MPHLTPVQLRRRRRAARELLTDPFGDETDRIVAKRMKVAVAKLSAPALMGPLFVVAMKRNGTDLEVDIELELVNNIAKIGFRHECDQGVWDQVVTGGKL